MTAPTPGWYPDNLSAHRLRWWDGQQWTDRVQARPHPMPLRPPLGSDWKSLAIALQVLLAINVITSAAGALGAWRLRSFAQRLLQPESVSMQEADAIDTFNATIAMADLLLWTITGIVFIVWLYRAHKSDRMEPLVLQHKSGWAIGGWFVPILGFWRPYQMVTDVRRGATGVRDPMTMGWQPWWWGALWLSALVANIAGRMFGRIDFEGPTEAVVEGMQRASTWGIAEAVVSMVAAIFAILMVRKVTSLVLDSPRGAR